MSHTRTFCRFFHSFPLPFRRARPNSRYCGTNELDPNIHIGALPTPWSVEDARCNVSTVNHILFVANVRISWHVIKVSVALDAKCSEPFHLLWTLGSADMLSEFHQAIKQRSELLGTPALAFTYERAKWISYLLPPILPFNILSNWGIMLTWMPILPLSTTPGVTVISSTASGTLGSWMHTWVSLYVLEYTESVCLAILFNISARYLQRRSAWRNQGASKCRVRHRG